MQLKEGNKGHQISLVDTEVMCALIDELRPKKLKISKHLSWSYS
jgi:hypothetical protein